MTYLKYATGFKGGGFSPRPSTAVQTAPFKPEKLKTLELGAKSELLNRRVRLNGAIFRSDYDDQQTFAQQCEPGTGGAGQPTCINWFRTMNAGKAQILGLEAEIQAEPVDNLRIEGSFGYIDYKLTDNQGNLLLLEGDSCGVSGTERCYSSRTPKYSGAVGIQYGFGVAGGMITPRLDMTYQSKIYFSTNNQGVQDGYSLLNGRVSYETQDKNWELSLYGRNLTDKVYFAGKLSLIGFFGREQGNVAPPREFGLTIKHNFK
jgi:iron complex outermembrane receptor protein